MFETSRMRSRAWMETRRNAAGSNWRMEGNRMTQHNPSSGPYSRENPRVCIYCGIFLMLPEDIAHQCPGEPPNYYRQMSRDISIVLSGNEPGSHWKHKERNTSYRVAGAVTIQSAIPVPDNTTLVLYRADESGFFYGRPRPEFQDGRFAFIDIGMPYIEHFLSAVSAEADFQRKKWGAAHDRSKSTENWYWLVGYLAGKALFSAIKGDKDKAMHHCVSAAAALMQWHSSIFEDQSGSGRGEDADLK